MKRLMKKLVLAIARLLLKAVHGYHVHQNPGLRSRKQVSEIDFGGPGHWGEKIPPAADQPLTSSLSKHFDSLEIKNLEKPELCHPEILGEGTHGPARISPGGHTEKQVDQFIEAVRKAHSPENPPESAR